MIYFFCFLRNVLCFKDVLYVVTDKNIHSKSELIGDSFYPPMIRVCRFDDMGGGREDMF